MGYGPCAEEKGQKSLQEKMNPFNARKIIGIPQNKKKIKKNRKKRQNKKGKQESPNTFLYIETPLEKAYR